MLSSNMLLLNLIVLIDVTFSTPTVGCDDIAKDLGYVPEKAKTPVPKQTIKSERPAATHRFVLGRFEGGVAFDTQTGQICKTWEWEPIGKQAAPDPVTGSYPQRAFGEFAPTCLSLYEKYPTGRSDSSKPDDEQ
jgi:hypothetical protein